MKIPQRKYTKKYCQWKDEVFKRDNFTCQKCGTDKKIIAHHHVPWNESIELRFDINNGQTLCRTCHMKHHYENAKKRWKKGNIPWNKGSKGISIGTPKGTRFTNEHRDKLSAAKKGKSPWNKGIKGKDSHSFGRTMYYKNKTWKIDEETGKRIWTEV